MKSDKDAGTRRTCSEYNELMKRRFWLHMHGNVYVSDNMRYV